MAKKLVEAITSMEDDFAQWYTDVVKKAERQKQKTNRKECWPPASGGRRNE